MTKRCILLAALAAFGCGDDPLRLRVANSTECDGLGGTVFSEGDEEHIVCNGKPSTERGPAGEPGAPGEPGPPGPAGAAQASPLALGDVQGYVSCELISQTNDNAFYTQRAKSWFFSSGWTFSSASLSTDLDDESQSDFTPANENPTFSFRGLPVLLDVIKFEMDLERQVLEVSQGNTVIATLPWDGPDCEDARM